MILLIIVLAISFFSGLSHNLITGVIFGGILLANHHPAGAGWWYIGSFIGGVLIRLWSEWEGYPEPEVEKETI